MSESGARNTITGPVDGNVVQAGYVAQIVFNGDRHDQPPIPRMLGRDPLHVGFHNRTAELEQLDRLLAQARERDEPLTVVLSGMPGVGKTMTALRWAHSIQDEFPDGALVVDLEATGPGGAASPFDLLGVLLRQLGVDDAALPPTESERGGLLQTRLESRSVLIVLDDAGSRAQVLPLLPSSRTSCVMVTSRHQLDIGSEAPVNLEPFSEREAIELISQGLSVTEDDYVALRRLALACDRLPLALRLAGARLRGRPSITSFAERVLARPDFLGELRAEDEDPLLRLVFDACYDVLPVEQKRAYRRLGLHFGAEVSVAAMAALLDVLIADAEELLEELARGHMLRHVGGDRFRMHALLHRHAAEKSRGEDSLETRVTALHRMVEHYHGFSLARDHVLSKRWRLGQDCYDRVPPVTADRQQVLQEMDVEHSNLVATVHTAAELGSHERAWQFCEALFPYQFDRNRHADVVAVNKIGISSAQKIFDAAVAEPDKAYAQAVLARMHSQYASGLFAAHEDDAAQEQFECALTTAVECGDARQEQSAIEWIGFLHERAGRLEQALESFDRAGTIVRERFPAQRQQRPLALRGMHSGRVLVELERHDEAGELLIPALEVFEGLDERGNVAKCALPLAAVEMSHGALESAFSRATRALETFEELRIHAWRVDALELLARLYARFGEKAAEIEALSGAAELAEVLGDPRAERLRSATQRS